MNDATGMIFDEETHLSLLEKLAAWGAWALAAWIFLTVGWIAVEPKDPFGPVSIFTHGNPAAMFLQAAGIAGVTAALATVIAGRRLADAGTFAAAVGLALVSLRGDTAGYLHRQAAELGTSSRTLALELASESLAWLVVALIALILSALVMRWCFGQPTGNPRETTSSVTARTLAGYDIPGIGAVLFGGASHRTDVGTGAKHTIIATVAGLIAFTVLSAGLSTRSIAHGQVCFVVAAAVCSACYLAYRMAPVHSPLWSILAVGLIAVVGYVWASIQPATGVRPPGIPASAFLRVLPIQYISVGTAAAVAMSWYMHQPFGPIDNIEPAHRRSRSPKEVD